jgi:hypothetical protein
METLTKDNRVFLPEVVRLVREGHRVKIVAKGYSMRPFVEDGRDLLVFDVPEPVAVGDVVLAEYAKGAFVCHRIVRMDGDAVTLRGDGNVCGVEKVTRADVLAKVVQIERKGKLYDLATSRRWKCYSFMWCHLLPLRRYLLAAYRRIWLKCFPVTPHKQL